MKASECYVTRNVFFFKWNKFKEPNGPTGTLTKDHVNYQEMFNGMKLFFS